MSCVTISFCVPVTLSQNSKLFLLNLPVSTANVLEAMVMPVDIKVNTIFLHIVKETDQKTELIN